MYLLIPFRILDHQPQWMWFLLSTKRPWTLRLFSVHFYGCSHVKHTNKTEQSTKTPAMHQTRNWIRRPKEVTEVNAFNPYRKSQSDEHIIISELLYKKSTSVRHLLTIDNVSSCAIKVRKRTKHQFHPINGHINGRIRQEYSPQSQLLSLRGFLFGLYSGW